MTMKTHGSLRANLIPLLWSTTTLVILTSVHHVYGAIHYQTPWRLHSLHLNIPIFLIAIVLGYLIERKSSTHLGRYSLYALLAIISIVWILWVGVYEGFYNHLVKDILFFSPLPLKQFNILFPPSIYENPNDVFFEITGTLQLAPLPWIFRSCVQLWGRRHSL